MIDGSSPWVWLASYAFPLRWMLPGIVVTILLATLWAGPVARRLRARRAVAWSLLAASGLVVSATLTPLGRPRLPGFEGCSFARVGPAPILDMRYEGDAAMNILLFIPLGLAISALPNGRPKFILILVAAAAPVAIEAIQAAVAILGRGCESADVIDNVTGLLAGLLAGSTLGWLWRSVIRPRTGHKGGAVGGRSIDQNPHP